MALAMCCRRALLKISGSIAATSQNHRATPSASSQPRSFCSVLPNEKEVFYAVDVKPKVAKKKGRGGVKSKKEKPSTEKAAEPPTPPPFPSSVIDQFKAGDRRKAVENENEKLPKRQSIQLPLHEISSHECTPTRTEIVRDLDRRNRFYKNTKRFIVTNCIECTGKLTSFISPVNASISCVRCGSLDRYENKREALFEKLPEMPVISDFEEIPLEDVDPILYDAVILEERRVVAEKKLMDA
uniref:Uncharacterized protein n=1 Tax=Plectus sambesii TaxID=2011161 RepID=A0A914UPY9_9BILA